MPVILALERQEQEQEHHWKSEDSLGTYKQVPGQLGLYLKEAGEEERVMLREPG